MTGLTNGQDAALFRERSDGVLVPPAPVTHRDDEYQADYFDLLAEMQDAHFWYRGRHRFLLRATRRECRRKDLASRRLSAVDLGGGCGGWVRYITRRAPDAFAEIAVADSALPALQTAGEVAGPQVTRYQIDLRRLPWRERWDVIFLLDVLEHIPEDVHVLSEVARALKPGGLLIVTVPALMLFWSHVDELVGHVRRYTRRDFLPLAESSGLELRRTRYFMTLLSPLLLLSRLRKPRLANRTGAEIADHVRRMHRVPAAPLNQLLALVFSLETPIGLWCPFPWGTSVLAVLRKPD
jgi:trans-aconitate methyltransferase